MNTEFYSKRKFHQVWGDVTGGWGGTDPASGSLRTHRGSGKGHLIPSVSIR